MSFEPWKSKLARLVPLLFTSWKISLVLNSSEAFFRYLYENQTCAVGIPQKNHLQIPNSRKEVKKLSHGEFSFRRNGNILLLRYQDKKEIYMLSTMRTADVIDVTK